MDWKTLFLTADGRMGRKDFWIGFIILLVANLVLGLVPLIGQIFNLVAIYFWVCLSSKRLHDMGKSGWLTVVPFVVWAVALALVAATSGAAIISAAASQTEGAIAAAAFGALGIASLLLLIAFCVGCAFLLWIGLTPPTVGDNRYGPPPVALVPGA